MTEGPVTEAPAETAAKQTHLEHSQAVNEPVSPATADTRRCDQ